MDGHGLPLMPALCLTAVADYIGLLWPRMSPHTGTRRIEWADLPVPRAALRSGDHRTVYIELGATFELELGYLMLTELRLGCTAPAAGRDSAAGRPAFRLATGSLIGHVAPHSSP